MLVAALLSRERMPESKRFVYVLRSISRPERPYTGITSNVSARLQHHNAGSCRYTAALRPWEVRAIIEFPDEERAIKFERYLKTGSGRAFAKRYFR